MHAFKFLLCTCHTHQIYWIRFRAKREQLEGFQGFLLESKGGAHNLGTGNQGGDPRHVVRHVGTVTRVAHSKAVSTDRLASASAWPAKGRAWLTWAPASRAAIPATWYAM